MGVEQKSKLQDHSDRGCKGMRAVLPTDEISLLKRKVSDKTGPLEVDDLIRVLLCCLGHEEMTSNQSYVLGV